MKILYLIRKKKKSYPEVAKIYGKNKLFTHKIVKKETRNLCSFRCLLHLKLQK